MHSEAGCWDLNFMGIYLMAQAASKQNPDSRKVLTPVVELSTGTPAASSQPSTTSPATFPPLSSALYLEVRVLIGGSVVCACGGLACCVNH